MSCQKGNVKRARPQKYQNTSAFLNDLHDTSKKTKELNNLEVAEVCKQCKDVIEWKIRYKKYKPLSQPKTCLQCHEKAIKFAYHTLCNPCGKKLGVCCKCRQSKEVIKRSVQMKPKEEVLAMMKKDLKLLPERKRRTFYRHLDDVYGTKKKEKKSEEEEEKGDKPEEKEPLKYCENYLEIIQSKLDELMKGMGIDGNSFSDDDDGDVEERTFSDKNC